MAEALLEFGITEQPQVGFDENEVEEPAVTTEALLLNAEAGIEFGFEDESAFLELDKSEFGASPMLLMQIYFYGVHEGVRPYRGRLPFDLRPRMAAWPCGRS